MRVSIAGKICFILLILFSLVLISTTLYQALRERELLLQMSEEKVDYQIQAYFDGLNIMMLTGTIGQREQLHAKMAAHPHVLSARVMRAESVNRQFGPGLASEQPLDHQDRLALSGQGSSEVIQQRGSTRLVVVRPFVASRDFRGTDCLSCHQAKEGEVLGAVRIESSLDSQLDQVEQHILTSALILSLIFGAGLLLALAIIHRRVVTPLKRISLAMERATDLQDLSQRLPVEQNDEIGRLNDNFNQLMQSLAERRQRRP